MPLALTLSQIAAGAPIDLPEPPPVRFGPDRLRQFAALASAGPAADPADEVDPLLALALLPALIADWFGISDAGAHRIAGLETCVFVRSIPSDAEVCVEGRLFDGRTNGDGHVVYRLGFVWRVAGDPQPAIVGELTGIAGNPGEAREVTHA
jgi:hypothetical protein